MTDYELVIFDDGKGRWGPMTDLRPVFDLRTGVLTNRQRIELALGRDAVVLRVPHEMAALVAQENPALAVNTPVNASRCLLVNGRWTGQRGVEKVCGLGAGAVLLQDDDQVVAANLEGAEADQLLALEQWEPGRGVRMERLDQRVLLERPWHILDQLESTLRADLEGVSLPELDGSRGSRHGAWRFGDHGVCVAQDARLQPGVVFNAELGPIAVDRGALVGAMSVLEGPCYIGSGTQVSCHAHIRPWTVIGPGCKVAGEISYSIMQGYSNKGHHGYLGHSLLGQWVNLGAATNVSNLKNTYGPVRMQLDEDAAEEDTGRQFQGPVIGDFTRTAIGTRLITGSCIGTGAMIARSRFAPKCVGRFTFMTDEGATPSDMPKFLATCERMMARRRKALSEALEGRLLALAQARQVTYMV